MKLCGQQTLCVRVPRHAEQSARALIQPIDGVIIKRCGVLSEQSGELFAECSGMDMSAGQGRQRCALTDNQDILIGIADEGRRESVIGRQSRAGHFAVVKADFQNLSGAKAGVGANGHAVAENAALDFEPPKGMRTQAKPSGNDAANGASRVLFGGDIGQNAHEDLTLWKMVKALFRRSRSFRC